MITPRSPTITLPLTKSIIGVLIRAVLTTRGCRLPRRASGMRGISIAQATVGIRCARVRMATPATSTSDTAVARSSRRKTRTSTTEAVEEAATTIFKTNTSLTIAEVVTIIMSTIITTIKAATGTGTATSSSMTVTVRTHRGQEDCTRRKLLTQRGVGRVKNITAAKPGVEVEEVAHVFCRTAQRPAATTNMTRAIFLTRVVLVTAGWSRLLRNQVRELVRLDRWTRTCRRPC
mmetsp:Transcript_26949/g.67885  ORF Transcript_26949/g.67885 Transcript_26949/m.67885 type:complete len:233 (+) Transcript_26949:1073-1771(+)